ncbi:uncharacterized protein EDB91DRAFT_1081209 [Suillus paluster]|uniref:uncharacterized protein n=1 Tax=Suillus paluster TaxID=48578 RepID=UPI001B860C1D|nr:uncharacterized protein EDB91DRAFT_1081209 [Suillus paluster]KAG1743270.1 hypothetical protein EDB91DRAFT_1081209 [Suillus paluster]
MLLVPDIIEVPGDGTDTPAARPVGPLPSPASSLDPSIFDTPFKFGSSTMLPYTTHTQCRLETLNAMGYEMKGHVVGPMPAGEFLQEFLPTSQIPNYDTLTFTSAFTPGVFSSTLSAVDEQHAYEPFVSLSIAMQNCIFFNGDLVPIHSND